MDVAIACVCCESKALSASPAVLMPFIADRIFGWKPTKVDNSWGLETIKNGQLYSICNTLQCMDCGIVFLDMRFSSSEMERLYRDYRGEEYTLTREKYEPGYTQRNISLNEGVNRLGVIENFLKPYVSYPIKLLDWGGDTGKNTPFQKIAESIHIYDISCKPVIDGATTVLKNEIVNDNYNLIVCGSVLEHVSYPKEFLSEIVLAMNKDTVLYIEVPYENIMQKEKPNIGFEKRHWHEHINFFSEKSLEELVNISGLSILSKKTHEVFVEGKSAHIFQIACKIN